MMKAPMCFKRTHQAREAAANHLYQEAATVAAQSYCEPIASDVRQLRQNTNIVAVSTVFYCCLSCHIAVAVGFAAMSWAWYAFIDIQYRFKCSMKSKIQKKINILTFNKLD